MKIAYLLTGLLFFAGLPSCHSVSETEKEIKQFLGSTVVLPDELVQSLSEGQSTYHLVMYLDSADCVPCSLEKITTLNYYKDDFEKFNTDIVLVVEEDENQQFITDFFTEMKIPYSLFFDRDDYLLSHNPIISKNPLCHAFITDKDRKVIWVGYPHANAETLERYKKMMHLLHKD